MAVKNNSAGAYDEPGIRSVEEELADLKDYEQRGVPIYVNKIRVTPEEWVAIVTAHEDGVTYMKDLVGIDTGTVTEIHSDKVAFRT